MKQRRITPNFLSRLKVGFPFGRKALLSSLGVAGTVIGALATTGTVLSFTVIIIIGSVCIILSLFAIIIKGHLEHLPDQIIIDECIDGKYLADYCNADTLKEANILTKPYYGREYVPDIVIEIWHQKNPKGFVHILNSKNELCACFSILGIEQTFMTQFIIGRLIDKDLLSNDVLNFTQTKNSNRLYVSAVVVRNPDSLVGHRRACVMIWAMVKYVKKYFGTREKRNIYALPVSKTSENLVIKCGFKIVSVAENRKDKLNLYNLEINKENLDKIIARIGDYSKMCECFLKKIEV